MGKKEKEGENNNKKEEVIKVVFWNVARLTNKDEEFYLWEKIKQWDKEVEKPNTTRPPGRPPKRWYESWTSASQENVQ